MTLHELSESLRVAADSSRDSGYPDLALRLEEASEAIYEAFLKADSLGIDIEVEVEVIVEPDDCGPN